MNLRKLFHCFFHNRDTSPPPCTQTQTLPPHRHSSSSSKAKVHFKQDDEKGEETFIFPDPLQPRYY